MIDAIVIEFCLSLLFFWNIFLGGFGLVWSEVSLLDMGMVLA